MAAPLTPTCGSSPRQRNNNNNSDRDDTISSTLSETISKMTLLDGTPRKQQQQVSSSPSSSSSSSSSSSLSRRTTPKQQQQELLQQHRDDDLSVTTPCVLRNNNKGLYSYPPMVKKASSLSRSQRNCVTPMVTTKADFQKMRNNSINANNCFVGRRKRQRGSAASAKNRITLDLPPLFPGSPELDDTSAGNPFRRHVPIHSPIKALGSTLNLEFAATIETSRYSRSSVSFPKLQSISSSEELNRIQNFFPVLDEIDDGNNNNNNMQQHAVSMSRALKMRRKCRKDNPFGRSSCFQQPKAFTTK